MATRFRLTQSTTAPGVSPGIGVFTTHTTPATVRRELLVDDGGTALTNTAYTPDAVDDGTVGTALWCQFVSDPMVAGKTFANGDTIKCAVQGLEAHVNNNLFVRLAVRVYDEAGTTLRRHLGNADCATELTTTLRNNFISFTQTGANYTTVAGDRLIVEVGVQGDPGTGGGVQGHNSTMRFGSDGGSGDLPENDTETGTGFNPWVEVVPSDLFAAGDISVTPGTASLTTTLFAPTVLTPRLVTPGVGTLTLTAFAPAVSLGIRLIPGVGSLTLTQFAPTVTATQHQLVTPGTATLTLSPFAPTVATPVTVTPGTATLTTTLLTPTVTVGAGQTVTPGTATLALTPFAPTVLTPRTVTPGTASLSTTTFAPAVLTPRLVTPQTASLTVTAFAPTVTATGAARRGMILSLPGTEGW